MVGPADAGVLADAGTVQDGGGPEDATADDAAALDAGGGWTALGPLPPAASASSDRFATADQCAFCHTAAGVSVLRDAEGADISPVHDFAGSMMSLSARDPYWLAAFSHELREAPSAAATVEATCTRCHATAASVELGEVGEHVRFDDIVTGSSSLSVLARDGASCTVCHQIQPAGLGTEASFTGGFVIDASRRIFGPYSDPLVMPMQNRVGYTPTGGAHLSESATCATCHTVITRALDEAGAPTGPELPEQVPYLEWRNSRYSTEPPIGDAATTCQGCHMPRTDESGAPYATIVSSRPGTLSARSPFGRHSLRGGNAQMLSVLAEETAWLGAGDPATLRAAAESTRGFLRTAATVTVREATRSGSSLRFVVGVRNHSGHRFPTSYPSRRAWLHVRVLDAAGEVVFESGASDASGRLVAGGIRLVESGDSLPHRLEITSADQVQVYQVILEDASGTPTHTLLAATRVRADNRLLPEGWSPTHRDIRWTAPTGTEGDPDFGAGGDDVVYRVEAPGASRIEVSLRFQAIPPAAVEAVRDSPAGARLEQMLAAHPQPPETVAEHAISL